MVLVTGGYTERVLAKLPEGNKIALCKRVTFWVLAKPAPNLHYANGQYLNLYCFVFQNLSPGADGLKTFQSRYN